MKPRILYEDNHILVAEKPANMPAQADSSGDADLLSCLKQYIKEKYHKPGAVYLGLCHRLDRPVSGIMVFARTSKAAARLGAQFRGGGVKKWYAAVVDGETPHNGLLSGYLLFSEASGKTLVFSAPAPGAKQAFLRYERLAVYSGQTLLRIELCTGRKHQIRAQLAGAGFPILHDQRYHPHPAIGPIALCAHSLGFMHPTKREWMEFHVPPQGGAFRPFSLQIMGLPLQRYCDISYLDDNILAVSKRAGIEVAAADSGDCSLQAHLEKLFQTLYPVHRLDANTPGILLYARNPAAESVLRQALSDEATEKIYYARIAGHMPAQSGILHAWARKDAQQGFLHVYTAPVPGAKPIKTGYEVLHTDESTSLLAVRLYTGLTHQIRAHFAFAGHPLLGDDKYGDRETNRESRLRRQALLAKRIRLSVASSAFSYLNDLEFVCDWDI